MFKRAPEMLLASRPALRKHLGTDLTYGTDLGKRSSSLYAPEVVFSPENMKKTVAKFEGMKPIRLQPNEPAKKAAVLIPLCVVDGKVSILYTQRAAHLKTHRGQVSFPGGMQDLNDKSLIATAVRETKEELGVKEEDIVVWGSGNMIVARGDTCVLPVIGHLKNEMNVDTLNISHQEVEEVFTVTLEDLCDKSKIGYTQFRGAYSTPVFLGGKRRIWGLTALITNLFLKSLLPSGAYAHRIKYVQSVRQNTRYFH